MAKPKEFKIAHCTTFPFGEIYFIPEELNDNDNKTLAKCQDKSILIDLWLRRKHG